MNFERDIISVAKEFPTLPSVYTALSEAMANPHTTVTDLAGIIATDQASASKVLRMANTPFYGFSGQIDTISKAIFYIGFNEVKNLVVATGTMDMFSKTKNSLNFSPVDLWRHAVGVGVVTRIIGQTLGVRNIENYFLSGILHDLGKLLFYDYVEVEYGQALKLVAERKISNREAEVLVLGISHTIAGELLAQKWKLPISIRNAIRYHHTGTLPSGDPDIMLAAIHIADITARALELGYAGDDMIPEPNKRAWEILNLPSNFFTQMSERIHSDYRELVALILPPQE